jgi:outer membrane protein insertion porin family/translocation and assembly module TamA
MKSTAIARSLSVASAIAGCASLLACAARPPPGRAAVDAVDFDGVESVGVQDLESKIATAPSPKFLGLFRGLVYDYELLSPSVLARDLERVERFYRARGYYEAHARAGRVQFVSPDHVRVRIVVQEGPPVKIGDIVVEGTEGLPGDVREAVNRAVARSGITQGATFDEDDFAAAEWRIRRTLEDRGYAFAEVARDAQVDLPSHLARVAFAVTPDLPATFGAITIEGLGALPEEPVRRALGIDEGERYSAAAIDSAQQALLDLGVFSSVAVRPERGDTPPEDRAVPIRVEVNASKLRSVRLGGGVELDVIKTAIHATAGWSDRNFLGQMRHFDVDFRPGVVLFPTRLPELAAPERILPEERLRVGLQQPILAEGRTDAYVRGQLNVYPLLLTPQIDPAAPVIGYREARGSIGANRNFKKLYADVSYELQYNSPFAYVGALDPDLQTVVISYVDFVANVDLRNDRVRPHRGFYFGGELQLAGGVLGGDAQDVRVQPQARAYFPVGHATLALRGTTGLLFPADYAGSLQHAPPGQAPPGVDRATWVRDLQLVYFRGFFSGGSSSNRGYPVYGVGPHGPVPFFTPGIASRQIARECVPGSPDFDPLRCGIPLGGLTLWETSAELRAPIAPQLEEVTFCDASDVRLGRASYRLSDPHLSCGVGLRYETPVGPVRLDVAYRVPGLNPRPGDPDYPGDIFGLPLGLALGIGEAY